MIQWITSLFSLLSLLCKPPHRHPERERANARDAKDLLMRRLALSARGNGERTGPASRTKKRPPLGSPEMAGVCSCADSESNREPKD